MTDEQKQKYTEARKERQKEYRKNMSDEQTKTKKLSKRILKKYD